MKSLYKKSDFSLHSFHNQESRSRTVQMIELKKEKEICLFLAVCITPCVSARNMEEEA